MKLSSIFLGPAPYRGGAVTLESMYPEDHFCLIGASVKTSAKNDLEERLTSLMIIPDKGKDGVVALSAWIVKGKVHEHRSFFVPVFYKDDNPYVELDHAFVSSGERIGQVSRYGVQVLINGEYFTSDKKDAEKNGKRYVPDANLLCRYVVNDVSAQVVIDAASAAKLEIDALAEAAELRKKMKEVEMIKDSLSSGLRVVETQRESLKTDLAKAEDVINSYQVSREELSKIAQELNDKDSWKPWGKKKRMKITMSIVDAYNKA